MKIIYPKSLNKKMFTIGVTAPSSGLGNDIFNKRFELLKKQHESKGIKVIEGNCLKEDSEYVSGTPKERMQDFIDLWNNPEVDLIQPPWGGAFLIDILEHFNFESLKNNPKWVLGYSDISTLTFSITTKLGIATAHGTNFMDSIDGQDLLTSKSRDFLFLKKGESFSQSNSEKWQEKFIDFAEKIDTTFNFTKKTSWRCFGENKKMNGRIVGGCIDTLKHLVGTHFGDFNSFKRNFCSQDGSILYLENCGHDPAELYRALYSMKLAGWFDNLNGVLLGRNNGPESDIFSYYRCIEKFFSNFNFPVMYDLDIGHKPPQVTIVNGALAEVEIKDGKGTLVQTFC